MVLAGLEGHECPGLAFDRLPGALHRDAPRDDLHETALANLMLCQLLATSEVDDHDPALRRREQHARRLLTT